MTPEQIKKIAKENGFIFSSTYYKDIECLSAHFSSANWESFAQALQSSGGEPIGEVSFNGDVVCTDEDGRFLTMKHLQAFAKAIIRDYVDGLEPVVIIKTSYWKCKSGNMQILSYANNIKSAINYLDSKNDDSDYKKVSWQISEKYATKLVDYDGAEVRYEIKKIPMIALEKTE